MAYCVHCGYNLDAHKVGDHCPECGRVVRLLATAPPPRPLFGLVVLSLVLLIPLIWLLRIPEPALFVLSAASVACVVVTIIASRQRWIAGRQSHWSSLALGAAAGISPLVTLSLFLVVFVFGGSSNVAQLAGESGFDLWSLWFHAWPFLLFSNPASAVIAAIAVAPPPYHPRYVAAWALPVAALIAAVAAAYLTVVYFPDA